MNWIGTNSAERYQGEIGERVEGRGGDDTLRGSISFGESGKELLFGSSNSRDLLYGGSDRDYLSSLGEDDTLFGGDGDDIVLAGSGKDLSFGGKGDDMIRPGAGNDRVFGDEGNDRIYNGATEGESSGVNYLHGGGGADTFSLTEGVFSAYYDRSIKSESSVIRDFNPNEGDKIELYSGYIFQYSFGSNGSSTTIDLTMEGETRQLASIENTSLLEIRNSLEWVNIYIE